MAEIAILSADTASRFDIKPRVAMISFSNFGNTPHPLADKVRQAVGIVRQRRPDLECDGEMQADTAVLPGFLQEHYPFARLSGLANADAIVSILMGMRARSTCSKQGVDIPDILNTAAYGVVEAQARESAAERREAKTAPRDAVLV